MSLSIEEIAMTLIGNSGEARSLAFEALKEAKSGNYEEAKDYLEKAKERSLVAHSMQTELICNEADGNGIDMNLLMVHAQDHLMTSILARELISEIIELYKKLENK